MKKFNKNKKKKNKVTKKRKTTKNNSDSQDSDENYKSLQLSNSPHNNNSINLDETNKWIETLVNETKNYDLEISSSQDSSSYSSKESNNKIIVKNEELESVNQKNKLGQVKEHTTEKIIKTTNKEEINEKESDINDIIEITTKNLIKFNGKDFKNYQKVNKYNNKRKIKKVIYKCKNYRKDEKLRIETNQKPFCEATLEYIEPGQNVKSGYFLKKEHSLECELFEGKEKEQIKNEIKISETKEDYILKCENIMNNSNIYDRHLFKESFKKIYNQNNSLYKFPLKDNFLSNIISNWKRKSVRFKKEGVLYDDKDFENRQLLREFRIIPNLEENNKKNNNYEYIIWGNSENIMRLRVSKNIFIDGIYHHPPGFYQLLIIKLL